MLIKSIKSVLLVTFILINGLFSTAVFSKDSQPEKSGKEKVKVYKSIKKALKTPGDVFSLDLTVELNKRKRKQPEKDDIPADLLKFTNLRSLILPDNYYNFPPSICKITSLKFLQLGIPYLTDFPDDFDKMVNLEKVVLLKTPHRGTSDCLDSMALLPRLKELVIHRYLERFFPDEFGKFPKLETLIFKSAYFKALPDTFHRLDKLSTISIFQGNYLTIFPRSFYKMNNLKVINLQSTKSSKCEVLTSISKAEECSIT